MFTLPEDDTLFLREKAILHSLSIEAPEQGGRRAISFPEFSFSGSLWSLRDGELVPTSSCRLLILIPDGYATTRLDSFYTLPRLLRADGSPPNQAAGTTQLFGEEWQFWSRHFEDGQWRPAIDGLQIYLNYIHGELGRA